MDTLQRMAWMGLIILGLLAFFCFIGGLLILLWQISPLIVVSIGGIVLLIAGTRE